MTDGNEGGKTDAPASILIGGCQCGAVRYEITPATEEAEAPGAEFAQAHYCHCRMCQRAVGNIVAVWVAVRGERFRWTAGAPATYRSSHYLERAFCRTCGTPLGARYVPGLKDWEWSDFVGVLVGSLDAPEAVRPGYHFGVESQVPWFNLDDGLPRRRTDDLPGMKELWSRAPEGSRKP